MGIADRVRQVIRRTLEAYPLPEGLAFPWREALVGYADASDPLFGRLREVAHADHLLPSDLLENPLTVVAFFLPFSREIASGNARGASPSRQWALAYIETNRVITLICERIAGLLSSCGYRSGIIAPTHTFDAQTLVSPWSHRHAAFIAGLGAFGLNRMLITKQGCCGRLGSLVTDAHIPPSPRPAGELCLFMHDGSCSACVRRCPGAVLTREGFDRHGCYRVLLENEEAFKALGRADVCGKCMCGLPCSTRDPRPRLSRGRERF